MFESTSFGKTMDILKRSMNASLRRQDVISDNLANADTPNFKRSDISFESELKRALDSENAPKGLQATLTDPKHIPFSRPLDYRNVQPKRTLDYLTNSKNNGNNVDLEQETMLALHNQLSYTMMAQIVNTQFQQINLVLR